MLFNSFDFIVFFSAVTAAYFGLPHKLRWALLLGASCAFYMCFVPIYIVILLVTIVIDYFAGIWIEDSRDPRTKKLLLGVSVLTVCGILFVFKYFNFFNENAAAIAAALDLRYPIEALRIILPIGLSFHTFQSLSYVIEVYRGQQKAERHFGIYALYVMYFPQLVAGPIERPQNLLHQFHEAKAFSLTRVRDGLSLALFGLFKKVVVADALSIYVDAVYGNVQQHSGATLLLATIFFTFQIYCDFSGYSDMARGVSRVYGVELMKNFDAPYLSLSITEFWSRWHISLSTWFRDYVYIPLGGNRVSLPRNLLNLFLVFILSGFWHGASWTFIAWGALHGTCLICDRLWTLALARLGLTAFEGAGPLRRAWAWATTFAWVVVSLVFFRADSMQTAVYVVRHMLVPRGGLFADPILFQGCAGIASVVALEYLNRKLDYWDALARFPLPIRFAYSIALLFGIVLFGIEEGAQFIYFQF